MKNKVKLNLLVHRYPNWYRKRTYPLKTSIHLSRHYENEHTVGIHNEHCSFPYDMCQRYYVFTMYIACDIIIWRHTNYLDLNDTYLENEHPYLKRSIHLSPHYENEHTQNFITNIRAFSIVIWVPWRTYDEGNQPDKHKTLERVNISVVKVPS